VSNAQPPARQRARLGLYMFTPMLGGAEMYLKDLLVNIDRDRYDVTLFYDSWPEFDEFLEFDRCPPLRRVPVQVVEPCGHYGARRMAGVSGGPGDGVEVPLNRLRQWREMLPRPLVYLPSRAFGIALRYLLVPLNFVRLRRAFRAHAVDVLHITNGGYPGALSAQMAALAARRAGRTGILMTVCGTPSPRTFPRLLERVLDAAVRRAVSFFVVPTRLVGDALSAHRGVPARAIRHVPFGVADWRAALGDAPGPPRRRAGLRVGMVASFQSYKGHRYLIEALATMVASGIDVTAVLVGGGPLRAEVEALVRDRGLQSRVECAGYIEQMDVFRTMASVDVLVLPSDTEGLPYVVLQAMSLGRPMVASAVGGIPDAIDQGESGLLVPPGDVAALAAALRRFAEDPALADRLGRNARVKYDAAFTLTGMVARHQALYDEVR